MKAIEAFAELISADDAPRPGVAVTLQHFRLDTAAWVNLASVTADSAGKAKLRVPMVAEDKGSAPGLRLIRADSAPAEVLSEGGRTVDAANTGILSVEFGRIRIIDPSEAVFLDDLGINLKPARAMGMTTIKVGDPDVAITELEAVVGFPLR